MDTHEDQGTDLVDAASRLATNGTLLPAGLTCRNVIFDTEAFDHLQQFKRAYARSNGVRLNNSRALMEILRQHKVACPGAV